MGIIATNSTRINSQGRAPLNVKAKSSVRLVNTLAAGATLPMPCSGTFFYVLNASAPLHIRPSGGVFDRYYVGTGMELSAEENAFNLLEVRNDNALPVAFEIFAGWDAFVDKRLILAQQQTPVFSYPTYPVASAATSVSIADQSGTLLSDINGDQFYAIYRVAIIVGNADSGTSLLLQKASAAAVGDAAAAIIHPLTSLRYDTSGDFKISHHSAATVNAIISEQYAGIPA